MTHPVPAPDETLACALAMIVAANGRIDARELKALDDLHAFRRIGVSRERFVDIARSFVADVGVHLCDRSWLCAEHLAYIDALLDAVPRVDDRMLVCRLAAAVIAADGRVTHDERLVFDHALARWRVDQSDVTQAILDDRLP